MNEQVKHNWCPLSSIPIFKGYISELLEYSELQYNLFLQAKKKPGLLEDFIIERALDLFTEQSITINFIKIKLIVGRKKI